MKGFKKEFDYFRILIFLVEEFKLFYCETGFSSQV